VNVFIDVDSYSVYSRTVCACRDESDRERDFGGTHDDDSTGPRSISTEADRASATTTAFSGDQWCGGCCRTTAPEILPTACWARLREGIRERVSTRRGWLLGHCAVARPAPVGRRRWARSSRGRAVRQEEVFPTTDGRVPSHELHWYLWLIGVDPAPGRGLAWGLRHALETCDRGRARVSRGDESAQCRYARHGFAESGVIQHGSSPPMRPMVHAP
jgi:hypothetical protein